MRKKNKIIKIKHVYYEYDYVDTILQLGYSHPKMLAYIQNCKF